LKKKTLCTVFLGLALVLSSVNAQTWNTNMRLTWNSGGSFFPFVTTDSNNDIHICWRDSAPGNAEIYYKKGIQ
jgi:hypothetical protein